MLPLSAMYAPLHWSPHCHTRAQAKRAKDVQLHEDRLKALPAYLQV